MGIESSGLLVTNTSQIRRCVFTTNGIAHRFPHLMD